MHQEKIKNSPDRENILKTLARKHDALVNEASGLEAEAVELRENLKNISEKDFPREDKKQEKEIDREQQDILGRLETNEAELKAIWKEINEIQDEQINLEPSIG